MRRPQDDEVLPLEDSLRWQEHYCSAHGAPIAAQLLRAVRLDLAGQRRLAQVLPVSTRFGDLPGLRIMAAAHRMAIDGRAPTIAAFARTLGGTRGLDGEMGGRDPLVGAHEREDRVVPTEELADSGRLGAGPDEGEELREAVVEALLADPDLLDDYLRRVPQTNEVGRSKLLRMALSRTAGPVRLFEIGASAGLNLRADHLPGEPDLESGPMPVIIKRLGCDLNPIDSASAEGRSLLGSYVWVDDGQRFESLLAAIDVAARVPATVITADAADFVESIVLRPGTTTVLWHSTLWVYLAAADRERIERALEALGAQASPEQPLWHVAWEWRPGSSTQHSLTLQAWDGSPGSGAVSTLATGTSHAQGIA